MCKIPGTKINDLVKEIEEKKLLFQGTRGDLESHAKECNKKGCVICQMAKETFQRWYEEEKEDSY